MPTQIDQRPGGQLQTRSLLGRKSVTAIIENYCVGGGVVVWELVAGSQYPRVQYSHAVEALLPIHGQCWARQPDRPSHLGVAHA